MLRNSLNLENTRYAIGNLQIKQEENTINEEKDGKL